MAYNSVTPERWGEGKEDQMSKVRTQYGKVIDFEAAMHIADDAIMESIHAEGISDTDQEFYELYCVRHQDVYGDEFEPDKECGQW